MADQVQTDQFIETLKQLGGSAGNGRLREALRWDEQTYSAIKSALIHEGVVASGRGRGGSVALIDYKSDGRQSLDDLFSTVASSNGQQNSAEQPAAANGNGVNGGSEGRSGASGTKSAKSPQAASFRQAFRNIDDALRKEAGCTTELDYTEQTSWLLFLKYLDDLEQDRAMEAALDGKAYTFILDEPYRWESWATPKTQNGSIDHNRALTGDDLCDFVNEQLCPYLQGFKQRASGPATLEYTDIPHIPSKFVEAALDRKAYTFILDEPYRWESWATPKTQNGSIDHNRALTGDDLCDFVNEQLCPYLQGFKQRASGPATLEYTDIPHIPSKFVEIVPLSHRQGNCIPYAAIRWHDFGNRPALGRPLGHFSRHPDTPLLSLSPRRRFPRPTPERVFVADHQSSSGFSGTGPSAPPPQPIGT